MSPGRTTLETVCTQDRTSIRPGHGDDLPYLGLEGIGSGTGQFTEGELSKTPEAPQANSFRFDERHVLYGKLRPYLNKVALPTSPGKCSTEIIPLLPAPQLDRQYLSYFLRSPATVKQIAERSSGARMPRADMDFVLSLPISLPAIEEQRRIVDLLARSEGIVRLRREAQRKAAELIPAIFIDMFGDPATNPMGWPVHSLGSLAEVQGGLQVTRARAKLPLERPYLRVANVHRGRLDLTEMKSIRLTETEFTRTALHAGDLLVVEGHGNPQEVGRVATWDDSIPDCTHQNHLIRARPLRDRLLPEYACALLNSEAGRQTLLRAGKTTSGLSTISARNVKNATVMLPPVADQGAFARHADAVASLTNQQAEAVNKATATFDALLSRAFH
jgi:type I restriction enzyme S subunit